jgi:hypothetical protein
VDVQPSHPGLSPHRRKFGFLFSKKNKIAVGAFPTAFPFKKNKEKKGYYQHSLLLNFWSAEP